MRWSCFSKFFCDTCSRPLPPIMRCPCWAHAHAVWPVAQIGRGFAMGPQVAPLGQWFAQTQTKGNFSRHRATLHLPRVKTHTRRVRLLHKPRGVARCEPSQREASPGFLSPHFRFVSLNNIRENSSAQLRCIVAEACVRPPIAADGWAKWRRISEPGNRPTFRRHQVFTYSVPHWLARAPIKIP